MNVDKFEMLKLNYIHCWYAVRIITRSVDKFYCFVGWKNVIGTLLFTAQLKFMFMEKEYLSSWRNSFHWIDQLFMIIIAYWYDHLFMKFWH